MIEYLESILIPKHSCILCSFSDDNSQYANFQKFILKSKGHLPNIDLNPPEIGIIQHLELTLHDRSNFYCETLLFIYNSLSIESSLIENFLYSAREALPHNDQVSKLDRLYLEKLIEHIK